MDDIDKIAFLIEAHDRGRLDEMREIMEARPARITPSDAPKKRQWAKTDELGAGEIIKGAFSTTPGSRIKSDPSKYAEIRAAAENNPFKVAMDAYQHEQYGNRRGRNKERQTTGGKTYKTLYMKFRYINTRTNTQQITDRYQPKDNPTIMLMVDQNKIGVAPQLIIKIRLTDDYDRLIEAHGQLEQFHSELELKRAPDKGKGRVSIANDEYVFTQDQLATLNKNLSMVLASINNKIIEIENEERSKW